LGHRAIGNSGCVAMTQSQDHSIARSSAMLLTVKPRIP
jgi:hypothetical protein